LFGQGWKGIPHENTSEHKSSTNKTREDKKETNHMRYQWNGGYAKENGSLVILSP
jgi:hypothetical protein